MERTAEEEGMNKIEFDEVCPSCKGTGLYVGIGERNGAAVVCHICGGTGCHHFVHEYEDFEKRSPKPGVKRVYRVNPGICIGEGNRCRLEDFGGMPYRDWDGGLPFPVWSEDRAHTCPAWWYQAADYDKKPHWKECGWGSFSHCEHFPDKSACWERWDKEFGGKSA